MRAAGLLGAVVLAGCFDPEFPVGEGNFACDEDQPDCPGGFECNLDEGACEPIGGGGGEGEGEGEGGCPAEPFDDPSEIQILEPRDGICIFANMSFVVTLRVDNFALDDSLLAQELVDGCGHWHMYLDGTYTGDPQVEETAEVAGFDEGVHTVEAELHDNFHKPVVPRVADDVTVCVGAEACDDEGRACRE
jgi:hypothetical protein